MSEQESTDEVFEGEEGQDGEEKVDEIRTAFDEAIMEELEEDDVKMAMIGAGATFKNVTRFYNKYMIAAGFAISKEDRSELVTKTLEGLSLEEEDDFNDAVSQLTEAVQGATERSASALVRAYAKKNDLPCYAKPKGEGVPRVSFASKFYDFLVSTPGGTKADAEAYIMGKGAYGETTGNVQNHLSHYMGIWKLARTIEEGKGIAQAA